MRDTAVPPSGSAADTVVLAGRIGKLAGTAQDAFAPAIARLHRALQASLPDAGAQPLLRALHDMHHAVTDAQCHAAGPAWLRWVPWLARGAAAEVRYVAHCHEALATRSPVAQRTRQLELVHRPKATEAARQLSQLLEMVDGLEVPLHEAQGLLHELWELLKSQRPDPAEPARADQLRAVVADMDTHRASVQRLEGTCAAARDVVRLGRSVLAARDGLLQQLGDRFERGWDAWEARVTPALREAVAPDQATDAARDATAARRALLQQLNQARATCTRLQIDEQALAHALVHLGEQLAVLGDPVVGDEATLPGHRPGASP